MVLVWRKNYLQGQAMLNAALHNPNLSAAERAAVKAHAQTRGLAAALGLLGGMVTAAAERMRKQEERAEQLAAAYRADSERIRAAADEMADEKRLDYHDPQPPKPTPSATPQQGGQTEPIDSATRSYTAWAKAVEEGRFYPRGSDSPSPGTKDCGWNPFCWIGKGLEWLGNKVKSWFAPKPSAPMVTSTKTLPPPQVFITHMPTSIITPSPTSTSIPYQQYKTVGPLTEWELRVGGQVAHNAHQLLAQASQFYFWSNDDPGQNSDPPTPLNYDQRLPISLDPAAYKHSWRNLPDVFEYTGGRVPFVCGDVVDWVYDMAGYNLTQVFPDIQKLYPNRWTRSAYGYELMFQFIRLGTIEGKEKIWDIQAHGDSYRFTEDNIPELGDIVVTKKTGNLQSPDAEHVVVVAEVYGFSPEQIIVIEGNPDAGTWVKQSLQELKNKVSDRKYIIYGHPNLP